MSVSFDQRCETLESIPGYVKIKTILQKPVQYVKKRAHLKKEETAAQSKRRSFSPSSKECA